MNHEIWSDDLTTMIELDDKPEDLTDEDWMKCERIKSFDDPTYCYRNDKVVLESNPMLSWDYYLYTGQGDEREGITWGLLIKGEPGAVSATASVTEFG